MDDLYYFKYSKDFTEIKIYKGKAEKWLIKLIEDDIKNIDINHIGQTLQRKLRERHSDNFVTNLNEFLAEKLPKHFTYRRNIKDDLGEYEIWLISNRFMIFDNVLGAFSEMQNANKKEIIEELNESIGLMESHISPNSKKNCKLSEEVYFKGRKDFHK